MYIITGASDGLGRELAKLFLADKQRVIDIARTAGPEGAVNIKCDLTKPEDIAAACEQLMKEEDKIQALINCAGVFSQSSLDGISASDLSHVYDVNLKAPILLTSGLIEKIKQDGADIVNVSSTVGTKAKQNEAAYSTSKLALRGFSANLQLELKDSLSRVISFCPGGFKSKFFEKATGLDSTADNNQWMDPKDVATLLKNILELPKNMEVSEIVINRKQVS